MRWIRWAAGTLAGFAAVAGCGGSGGSTGPGGGGGGGGGGGSGGISAVIDGVPWTSATVSEDAQVGTFGVILIQGSQNGTTIQIVLYNVDSVGTYRLGMGGTNVGGYAQVTDLLPRGWSTPLSGAAGTVTITTLTAGHIVGTFAFTADSLLGAAQGQRVVTNGQFDLLLGGTLATLPDNYGSRLDGTVGGAAWHAATVVMQLQSGTLVVGGSNTAYSISIAKTSFAGVGTYPLGSAPGDPVVVMSGPWTNPNGPVNCCWGGGTGNTGTLEITSLTATRIQGTLSATLVPSPATAATTPLTLSNVTFDIGRP